MGPHLLIKVKVLALTKQVEIKIAKDGRKFLFK
jgi:hypothetical protein